MPTHESRFWRCLLLLTAESDVTHVETTNVPDDFHAETTMLKEDDDDFVTYQVGDVDEPEVEVRNNATKTGDSKQVFNWTVIVQKIVRGVKLYLYFFFRTQAGKYRGFRLDAILGVALAALFIIVALLLLVCFLCKRKKRKHTFRQVSWSNKLSLTCHVCLCFSLSDLSIRHTHCKLHGFV